MNFCTKCGNPLNKNDHFCTSCGQKIKREGDFQKPLLILGIFLVLFATFILGIFSWENMSSILRIVFFGFECLLFFALSFILKKVGSKLNRLFYVIGLILIPYTLSLVAYYNLLPSSIASGAGVHIYLAIIYFITFIIYILLNVNFKSKFIEILSLISLLVSFINIGLIFSKNISIITLLIVVYSFILYIMSLFKVFNTSRTALKIVSTIVNISIILLIFISFIFYNFKSYMIINSIILFLYVLLNYLYAYLEKGILYKVITPYLLFFSFIFFYICLFINSIELIFYFIIGTTLILYFVSLLIKNKIFKINTIVLSYVALLFILLLTSSKILIPNPGLIPVTTSLSILCINVCDIFINKYKFLQYILPFSIFLCVLSIIKYFTNLQLIYILVGSSLIYLIIYTILKSKKSSKSFIYILASFVLSFISFYNFGFEFKMINISIPLIILIIHIFSLIFNENKGFSILTYIFLNLSLLFVFDLFDNSMYYGLLSVSGVTLLIDTLIMKFTKIDLKPYILYSEIVVLIITLFNNYRINNIVLFIGILVYAFSYLTVLKYYNKKSYRILYIMVGLFTITRVIGILIEPIVISSIISIATILIIITIMYLLDVEDKWGLTLISTVVLIPYYSLINSALVDYSELYIIPLMCYIIVLTELYEFKNENDKKLWTIIPLSILSFFLLVFDNRVGSIIIDLIVALTYILLGVYRKYNYLIYFGIIFIVVTLFIQLFTILNSMIIVIILIIIGFILIGVALYNELKKKE